MNILDKIIIDKKREVLLKKSIIPVSQLEASVFFEKQTISLSQKLKESPSGIIAEHKRRSPSKSIINNNFTVEEVVKGYENALNDFHEMNLKNVKGITYSDGSSGYVGYLENGAKVSVRSFSTGSANSEPTIDIKGDVVKKNIKIRY